MTSGGTYVDASGREQDKLRAAWRLDEPTRGAEGHALMQETGRLSALYSGADLTAASPVHPHRWPGALHQKGTPRVSRVLRCNLDAEINLIEAAAKLRDALEVVGIPYETAPSRDYATSVPEVPIEAVREAMGYVPNAGLDWAAWNEFGMAIYITTGGSEDGFEIFDAFSRKADKYDAEVTRDRHDHYRKSPPTRTGWGKIDAAARKNGWGRFACF